MVKIITTLLVELSACFPAPSPPTSDSKLCRVVYPNHSLWLSTSHLTTLRLHMILTKTATKTDKSSSSQERPNLIFRRTPFYFVTYCPFCNLIAVYAATGTIADSLRASVKVWLRVTTLIDGLGAELRAGRRAHCVRTRIAHRKCGCRLWQ